MNASTSSSRAKRKENESKNRDQCVTNNRLIYDDIDKSDSVPLPHSPEESNSTDDTDSTDSTFDMNSYSMGESSNSIYDASPEDVILTQEEKISDGDTIMSGININDMNNEIVTSTNKSKKTHNKHHRYNIKDNIKDTLKQYRDVAKRWSASATMEEMVRQTSQESSVQAQVNSDTFQVFVQELVRDKSWNEKDFIEFINSARVVAEIIATEAPDKILAMLSNPKYYGAIYDILDKLDTLNVLSVLGTGNKCEMIRDPQLRTKVKRQIMLTGRLIDMFTPLLAMMITTIDKIVPDSGVLSESTSDSESNSRSCESAYIDIAIMLKKRATNCLLMRRLTLMTQPKSIRMEQKPDHSEDNNDDGDSDGYLLLLLLFVIVSVFVYVLLVRTTKNA